MSDEQHERAAEQLRIALGDPDGSSRLQAALSAGTYPAPEYIEVLVARCAIEPDFSVREMLTWALIRQDPDAVLERLLPELTSEVPQARAQALHTLSKLRDARAWAAITPALLHDDDTEVARTAWRTAAGLAPDAERPALARMLAEHLGTGDRSLQRSLSRALVMLGHAATEALTGAAGSTERARSLHALATLHLIDNPDDGFDAALDEARRARPDSGAGE